MNIAIAHLSKSDAILATLINAYKEPLFCPHTNYYEELVSSIISQQLSVKAASAIKKRFNDLFIGDFPTPEEILEKDIETFRSAGLSRPKALYIQDLAHHIIDDTIRFEDLNKLSNQAIIEELTKVKGIGEWTVHMFLIFCMGRLNVLPHGDLGIRNGITNLYGYETTAKPEDVKNIALKNKWHPYESVASWYIWQSLDNAPKVKADLS